jgi:zinc finger SWIM domain-containing protein 3
LYDTQTCDEFKENWQSVLECFQLQDNAWLRGLYSEQTFWLPAYMKDRFCAGMATTQQSETMNSFFMVMCTQGPH